jgi:hypothetical protein
MKKVVSERSSCVSKAIRMRKIVRARKDQKAKDKDALELIIKYLGDEQAVNIKMTWKSFERKGTVRKTGEFLMLSLGPSLGRNIPITQSECFLGVV